MINDICSILKDKYRYEAQCEMRLALALNAGMLSILNGDPETIDPDDFKEMLCDVAKVQADASTKNPSQGEPLLLRCFQTSDQHWIAHPQTTNFCSAQISTKLLAGTEYVCPQTQAINKLASALRS